MGEILALCCAVSWSAGVVLFKKCGDKIPSIVLNLLKNGIGFLLLIPTLFVFEGRFFIPTSREHLTLLVLSGVLGIGIADVMFLEGLKRIGASRTALLDCLYAPSVILLSMIFLGDTLTLRQAAGGLLVISAIFFANRGVNVTDVVVSRKDLISGTIIGAAAIFLMAGGIVIMKPLLHEVPLFWIIQVRLGAGFAASTVFFIFARQKTRLLGAFFASKQKPLIILACVVMTYVSMIFWVSGFKYSSASVVAILNQMSTIFTVLFAAALLGERLTRVKVIATVVAVFGVLLITL